VRTAVEAQAAGELSRFLGADAAVRIRGGDQPLRPGDGETRTVAIAFIDLRGFTPTTRGWPAADVVALLADFHARVVPAVEAAGGTIDKFMGDGVLVSFGAASVTGREAAQALEAASAVMAACDAWAADRGDRPTPGVAVAIATGDVAYGVVGHRDRLEYTVIGDAVNLAAKLEKHAKVEHARIIGSAAAVDRARAQGWTGAAGRPVPAAEVAGVDAPLDLVVLA
jgi:adenylate cyclase